MTKLNEIYAKIGFKVDTQQLDEAKKKYKAFASVLRKASTYMKSSTKATADSLRLQTLEMKKQTAEAKKLKAEAELKAKLDSIEERETKRREREEARRLRRRAQRIREFGREVRNAMLTVTGFMYGGIAGSRDTRETALEYRDFARQTGLSVEGLQQYQMAAYTQGSRLTGTDIANQIRELQQNLVNIEFGQGDLFPYKMLGVAASTKNAMNVIEALRESIKGLDDARALNLIEKMGLSADWLHLLRQSKEEFDKLNAVMLSKGQIEKTTKLALAFRQTGFALKNMKDQFIALVSGAMSTFSDNLRSMVTDFSIWLKQINDSPNALRGLAIGLGLVMTAISPLATALTGVYLILEDIYVASKGGKSLFKWDKQAFQDILESLRFIAFVVERVIQDFIELGKLYHLYGEEIGEFVAAVTHPIDAIKSSVNDLRGVFSSSDKNVTINNNIDARGMNAEELKRLVPMDGAFPQTMINTTSAEAYSLGV